MANSQGANLQKIVGVGTAVVGGIALMTKLGIDEFQHRNMKAKTDPSNAYSKIRILPDLVRFQGYIRIHRHQGEIVLPVPKKMEIISEEKKMSDDDKDPEEIKKDESKVSDNENVEGNDVEDTRMKNEDEDEHEDVDENKNHHKKLSIDDGNNDIAQYNELMDEDEETPKNSGWFSSISKFASSAKKSFNKIQTLMEQQTIEFNSDFPFILKDSAIHKTELESYIMKDNKFLELFEPQEITKLDPQNAKSNNANSASNNSKIKPLNEKWEFCAVKIHHETLYIRYAKKWITLPLNEINIQPLTLDNNDCTAFIVDYQKYFTISEDKGYVLLCQHLDDPFIINHINSINNRNQRDIEAAPIDIPEEHTFCPWPYVQKYLIGYHNTSYVSLRKEQVLKAIVERVSIAMKDVGFDNHTCYDHAIQFRKCIDTIISEIDGADKALQFKHNEIKENALKINDKEEMDLNDNPYSEYNKHNIDHKQEDDDDDNDVAMSSKQEGDVDGEPEPISKLLNDEQKQNKDKVMEEQEQKQKEFLPYLSLLTDRYHGLNIDELSEIDWRLTAEAAWLSNYVYEIYLPQPEQKRKRRDSWSQFKAYISTSNLKENENNINDVEMDDNVIDDDGLFEFCGPPHLAKDKLWKKHNRNHCEHLSKCGFQMLDYAVTQPGQSVQWMITRSYDNPNTIFLTFKGTSNPLDGMVNIGMHPLELPHFQCSVFSGMYAALQQSLPFICRRLKIYASEQYFQYNPCPPINQNINDNDNNDENDENDNKNITKIYKLIINGHSLGGGYAQLFLAHLLSVPEFEEYFETIKCITFASPLVFCKDIEKSFLYKKLNDKIINFIYQFDLVPRLQNGMEPRYRNKLLQGLLLSQLPVSNIGMVFDINQRLNYVLNKLQDAQWLLDRYCSIGKYVVLFEKDEPRPIDKKQKCFTKSAKSYHLILPAEKVLTLTSMLKQDETIYAVEVLKDHKMLNYMKCCMFQQI